MCRCGACDGIDDLQDFVIQVPFRLRTHCVVGDLRGKNLLVLFDHTSHFSFKSTCVPLNTNMALRTGSCETSLKELKHKGGVTIVVLMLELFVSQQVFKEKLPTLCQYPNSTKAICWQIGL